MNDVLNALNEVILKRKREPLEGSYTCYLFEKGLDKILKKCGEECTETVIAAKNGSPEEIVNESCDLIYHLLVMLAACEVPLESVIEELARREQKQRNLKVMKTVDKNT